MILFTSLLVWCQIWSIFVSSPILSITIQHHKTTVYCTVLYTDIIQNLLLSTHISYPFIKKRSWITMKHLVDITTNKRLIQFKMFFWMILSLRFWPYVICFWDQCCTVNNSITVVESLWNNIHYCYYNNFKNITEMTILKYRTLQITHTLV